MTKRFVELEVIWPKLCGACSRQLGKGDRMLWRKDASGKRIVRCLLCGELGGAAAFESRTRFPFEALINGARVLVHGSGRFEYPKAAR